MTSRLPLVVGPDGLQQQLQSGDTLNVPTTTTQIRPMTNGEASNAIVIGAPVYASAADTMKRGQANAKSTSQLIGLGYDASTATSAIGNVITDGVLVATTTQWDAVAGTTGGLAFGTRYFLDPANPGKITSTVPTTVGQCVTLVGIALSTTELDLQISPPILL